jgi:hypothetical protein
VETAVLGGRPSPSKVTSHPSSDAASAAIWPAQPSPITSTSVTSNSVMTVVLSIFRSPMEQDVDRHSAGNNSDISELSVRSHARIRDQGNSASSRVSPMPLALSSGERCRKTKRGEAHRTAWRVSRLATKVARLARPVLLLALRLRLGVG